MAPITIRNLVKLTNNIQHQLNLEAIRQACQHQESIQTLKESIIAEIKSAVSPADRILQESGLDPGALSIRSRRAYQWLKYLESKKNLNTHLDALHRIALFLPGINRTIKSRQLKVEFLFYNLGSIYKVNRNQSEIKITAQQVLTQAPDRILIAVLENTLGKANDQNRNRLQTYTYSQTFRAAREKLEYLGINKGSLAAGRFYHLQESFARVNKAYFNGKLPEPHLVWSRRLTHRKFGHYQWDIDTVMVSKSLDQASVPAYVVDYVMYHELLHKRHGAKLVKQRRRVHTPAFREDERQYEEYEKAQKWLTKFATQSK